MKKFVLFVEEKAFVNDKGEKVTYNAIFTEIEGQRFKLNVDKDEKKLFNYVIKNSK